MVFEEGLQQINHAGLMGVIGQAERATNVTGANFVVGMYRLLNTTKGLSKQRLAAQAVLLATQERSGTDVTCYDTRLDFAAPSVSEDVGVYASLNTGICTYQELPDIFRELHGLGFSSYVVNGVNFSACLVEDAVEEYVDSLATRGQEVDFVLQDTLLSRLYR